MEHKVATRSQFASNSMLAIEVNGTSIVLVKEGEQILALEDRCSHAEVQLSEGSYDCGQIECPAHGAKFCVKTGKALCLPAVTPVKTFPVRVAGDDVFVEVD